VGSLCRLTNGGLTMARGLGRELLLDLTSSCKLLEELRLERGELVGVRFAEAFDSVRGIYLLDSRDQPFVK
jgi:hypothetical protein